MGKEKVVKGSEKYFREQIKKEWAKHSKELDREWKKVVKQSRSTPKVDLGAGAPKLQRWEKRVIKKAAEYKRRET